MILGGLLFAHGRRPSADALRQAAAAGNGFTVLQHPGGEPGWAEVLADGLTFDLDGLAPGRSVPLDVTHFYGFPPEFDPLAHDAVALRTGPHLEGAERLLPVVRVAAGLLAALSALPDVAGVVWAPSAGVTPPAFFAQVVNAWLAGGPFPALALCALQPLPDGGIASHGLDHVAGQDFVLGAGEGVQANLAKAAMRLADWLVAHGPLGEATDIVLSDIGTVRLEPVGTVVSARIS